MSRSPGEAVGLRWPFLDIDVPDGEPGEMRVWYQLQRLPWRHGCGDPAACSERWHKRPCPKRCPKAARKSGRRHQCAEPGAKGLCPPDCAGHAAQCPDRTGGGLVFREIKERRRKTVPVPSPLVRILRAHRAQQNRQRLAAAKLWEDFGVVFAQENGRPPTAGRLAGVVGHPGRRGRPHAGTHSMRHSAATIGLDQGTALAVVQELLGHSDIRVARGYTLHVSSAQAADGAERIGRALFGAK